MPIAMAAQIPPLVPPEGRSLVPYTYVSGVPEDPDAGILYPATADGQPVFLLTRHDLGDTHYARAFCGFEPYLLTLASHQALVEYVLLQRLSLADVSQQP